MCATTNAHLASFASVEQFEVRNGPFKCLSGISLAILTCMCMRPSPHPSSGLPLPLQGVLPLLLHYAPSDPWVGLRSESTTPGAPWSASMWADGTTPLRYTRWAPSYPDASKGACVATSQVSQGGGCAVQAV